VFLKKYFAAKNSHMHPVVFSFEHMVKVSLYTLHKKITF